MSLQGPLEEIIKAWILICIDIDCFSTFSKFLDFWELKVLFHQVDCDGLWGFRDQLLFNSMIVIVHKLYGTLELVNLTLHHLLGT